MKAFLVANPKGGSGKSTLATNLAGYFASRRHDVMLGDIDRQQSARDWLAIRPFELPTIDTWDIGPDKIARPPKGTSHVVLDTPAGLHGKALDKVLKLFDAGHRAGPAVAVRHAGDPSFPRRAAVRKGGAQGAGRRRGNRHAG